MKEKEILDELRLILNQKRNEYISTMQQYESSDNYYHYCHGKKDMIEDIIMFINNKE